MPDGKIVTPDIKDAERLQGFRAGWTKPAGELSGDRRRWQLVGNAVTVTAAAWIGEILSDRSGGTPMGAVPLRRARSWPNAAFGGKGKRWMAEGVTEWPRAVNVPPLAEFLRSEPKLLSAKATEGFLTRLRASSLRYPVEFEAALTAHLSQMKRRLKESVVSV
jgi:DNA (cytosine-5)-methyltransferase 1